jgi:hypothetical protein
MQREWPSGFKADDRITFYWPILLAYKFIVGICFDISHNSAFFYEETKQ